MSAREPFANSTTVNRGRSNGILGSILCSMKEEELDSPYEPDVHAPLFSMPPETTRPLSLTSQSDDDAIVMIVANPELWKEFQGHLVKTGRIISAKIHTKEVLREFVKEKGLDQGIEEYEDDSRARATMRTILSQALKHECLGDPLKQRPGVGLRQVSTTARLLRAARQRSDHLSAASNGEAVDDIAITKRRMYLSKSSLLDLYLEEEKETKNDTCSTLALATSMVAALNRKQKTRANPAA